MNIKSLTIKNIKSFGDETSIIFQDGLNIFIGPNAGGKSNLLDILNITILYFFLYPWRINSEYNETGGIRRKYFQERHIIFDPITNLLEKHLKRSEEDQRIKIVFIPEKEDIDNIKIIQKFQNELIHFEKNEYNSNFLNGFLSSLETSNIDSMLGKELDFIINNNNPIQISNLSSEHKNFFLYLNFFNFISLLVENYNQFVQEDSRKIQHLHPPIAYFSPYRIPRISNLTVNISAVDFFNLWEGYLRSDSKSISSTFEISNYYFAKKLRYLNDDINKFASEGEINLIKKYIRKLGYKDFGYECKNKEKNIYEGFLVKVDDTKLDLSKASSGEKEILNFLLGIFALNIKNGVLIIDEPELHLHPKWQRVLLELFDDFAKYRGIQFFIVTHSPYFITPESIRKTFRVYFEDGESRIVVPQNLDENDKDLFMLVNIFNNTKVFFADKIILVEGDVDLIIYESILERLQFDMQSSKVIEIIKIQQEGGVKKNKNFLEKWQIKTYAIVDKDKSNEVQELDRVFILKKGKIEDYFRDIINKDHYSIDDALKISKKIKDSSIPVPQELEEIFKKIINDN